MLVKKNMRNVFLLLLIFLFDGGSLYAQSDTTGGIKSILDEMPYVTIYQSDSITSMLKKIMEVRQKRGFHINGYRVQVYSSNQQQIAREEALQLEEELSLLIDEPVYIQYDSPFWKIRIGNFKTQVEANEYKLYLINIFPKIKQNTYVVRDIIKL